MDSATHPTGPLIAVGRTAEVYAWGDGQALKLFYAWCPAVWSAHEAETGRKMNISGLPVPKLLGEVEVDGRPGILYERVRGPSMLRVISARPWLIPRMARLLAGLQAEIHQRDGAAFSPLRGSLEAGIRRAEGLSSGLKELALERLERMPEGGSLCHFDFHPDQVLITEEGPVVLDWMTATCGPPPADIARTALLLTIAAPPGASSRQAAFLNVVRRWFHDNYLERSLELHPGTTHTMVEAWKLPVAAARLGEDIPAEQDLLLHWIESECQQNC